MKTKVIKALNKAAEFLDKNGWTQGTYARDKDGNPVDPESKDAVSFCAVGVLDRIKAPNEVYAEVFHYLTNRKHSSIPSYNDKYAKDKRYIQRLFRNVAKEMLKNGQDQ